MEGDDWPRPPAEVDAEEALPRERKDTARSVGQQALGGAGGVSEGSWQPLPEQLSEQETPFFTVLKAVYQDYEVCTPASVQSHRPFLVTKPLLITTHHQPEILEEVEDRLAQAQALVVSSLEEHEGELTDVDVETLIPAAVELLKTRSNNMKESDGWDDFALITTLAFIAARYYHEGFDGKRIPRLFGEELPMRCWRIAINNLLELRELQLSPEEQRAQRVIRHLSGESAGSITQTTKGIAWKTHRKQQKQTAALRLLEFFSIAGSKEMLQAELQIVGNMRRGLAQPSVKELLSEFGGRVHITDWEILPRGKGQKTGIRRVSSTSTAETGDSEPDVYKLEWLNVLLDAWESAKGYRGEIYRSKLSRRRKEPYYVVVLPEQLSNGDIVEHAVGDNPMKENAIYVFRGDKASLGPDGRRLTWRDVYDRDKNYAQQHGAIRLVHTSYVRENAWLCLVADDEGLRRIRSDHVGHYRRRRRDLIPQTIRALTNTQEDSI